MSSTTISPGQTLTKKFPVTGEKQASRQLTKDNWSLSVFGEVEKPVTLTLGELLSLPQSQFEADIHCVTSWSQLGMTFEGVRFATLVNELVDLKPHARFVRFVAYSDRKHDTSLPIEAAMEDSWLVQRYNGETLAPETWLSGKGCFTLALFLQKPQVVEGDCLSVRRSVRLLGTRLRLPQRWRSVARTAPGRPSFHLSGRSCPLPKSNRLLGLPNELARVRHRL